VLDGYHDQIRAYSACRPTEPSVLRCARNECLRLTTAGYHSGRHITVTSLLLWKASYCSQCCYGPGVIS